MTETAKMQDLSIEKGQHEFLYVSMLLIIYLFIYRQFYLHIKLGTQEAHPGSWQYIYFGYNWKTFLNRAEEIVQ